MPLARPDGSAWPRISIVTPSYNQGQFIEETIRSVLLQGYPDLEYIIIDGGSTDQSVEIIKKYEPWLTYWVSEKDRGQAHAINKGLNKSTGEIFQWINSDDLLLLNSLFEIARAYAGHIVAAPILLGFDNTTDITVWENINIDVCSFIQTKTKWAQQGLWLVRDNVQRIEINERLHYAFDFDMIVKYLESFPMVTYIHEPVAFFRYHDRSKTIALSDHFRGERFLIMAHLSHSLANPYHRALSRKAVQGMNWQRHLTEWRRHAPGRKRDVAMRMILLALRKPRQRIGRFWLGALRRMIIPGS